MVREGFGTTAAMKSLARRAPPRLSAVESGRLDSRLADRFGELCLVTTRKERPARLTGRFYFLGEAGRVDGGRWTVDGGQWTVDSGQWTVDSGRWTVDGGRWTVDSGQWTVDSGRWIVDGKPATSVASALSAPHSSGSPRVSVPLPLSSLPAHYPPSTIHRPPSTIHYPCPSPPDRAPLSRGSRSRRFGLPAARLPSCCGPRPPRSDCCPPARQS